MPFTPGGAFTAQKSIITPFSRVAIGAQMAEFIRTAAASAAYPLANLALFVPFSVPEATLARAGWWANGTVTGGNCDVGIYDEGGVRLVSLGSTARGAASASVLTSFATALPLVPGVRYYMAFSHNGTNNFFRAAPVAPLAAAAGMLEMTTAFPLPAPATYAIANTRAYVPAFGIVTSAGSIGI